MKLDSRAVIAALALILASCQGAGLDSGMGGGGMEPPVSQQGSIGAGGMNGAPGLNGNGMNGGQSGPTMGMNGQAELANPGATLAPNEAQYPVSQGPSGMKCPNVMLYTQQFGCNLTFNMPSPTPMPSGSPAATTAPTPTPTATPSPASSDDSDDSDDTPTPSPPPGGTLTLQVEGLPKDVPSMTNASPLLMHVGPVMALRLQSTNDFVLNGGTQVQFTLPAMQFSGRVFTLQLYNESYLRGKRTDLILGNYSKWTSPESNVVQFTFNVPKITVRHTQIWLLVLYSAQLPPGSTPTPSPTPQPTASPSSSP